MPDQHDWDAEDDARRREALQHSMFNPDIPGHSLYEGGLSRWVLPALLAGVVILVMLLAVVF